MSDFVLVVAVLIAVPAARAVVMDIAASHSDLLRGGVNLASSILRFIANTFVINLILYAKYDPCSVLYLLASVEVCLLF